MCTRKEKLPVKLYQNPRSNKGGYELINIISYFNTSIELLCNVTQLATIKCLRHKRGNYSLSNALSGREIKSNSFKSGNKRKCLENQ